MEPSEDYYVSREVEAFYAEIRTLVLLFLLLTLFLFLSHLVVRHFVVKGSLDGKYNRVDRVVHQIVLGICTFTLTISFASFSLPPLTILVNELLWRSKQSYYTHWLDSGIVHDLFFIVNIGTKVVCILLPFSFFLLISQKFRGFSNSFGSRFLEAISNLLFFYVLVFGTIWSFDLFSSAARSATTKHLRHSLPTVYCVHPFSFLLRAVGSLSWTSFLSEVLWHTLLQLLECLQLFSCLVGLCALFTLTPLGLLSLGFDFATNIHTLSEFKSKSALYDRLLELRFRALCTEDNKRVVLLVSESKPKWYDNQLLLSSTEPHIHSNEDILVVDLIHAFDTKLRLLEGEFARLRRFVNCQLIGTSDWFRPRVLFVLFSITFFLFCLTQSFVLINVAGLCKNLIFEILHSTSNVSYSDGMDLHLFTKDAITTLGRRPASSFGFFGVILQLCVIHFLLVVGLWGFYALPVAKYLRPKARSLTIEATYANVILLLLFSLALPLQSNLLGLSSITLPNLLQIKQGLTSTRFFKVFANTCSCEDKLGSFPTRNGSLSPLTLSTSETVDLRELSPLVCEVNTRSGVLPLVNDSAPHWFSSFVFVPSYLHSAPFCCTINRSSADPSVDAEPPFGGISFVIRTKSISARFSPRVFGSSTSFPTSWKLVLMVLLYNFCFLLTSVWVARRRLGNTTFSISLDSVVPSPTCLSLKIPSVRGET